MTLTLTSTALMFSAVIFSRQCRGLLLSFRKSRLSYANHLLLPQSLSEQLSSFFDSLLNWIIRILIFVWTSSLVIFMAFAISCQAQCFLLLSLYRSLVWSQSRGRSLYRSTRLLTCSLDQTSSLGVLSSIVTTTTHGTNDNNADTRPPVRTLHRLFTGVIKCRGSWRRCWCGAVGESGGGSEREWVSGEEKRCHNTTPNSSAEKCVLDHSYAISYFFPMYGKIVFFKQVLFCNKFDKHYPCFKQKLQTLCFKFRSSLPM